MTSVPVPAPPGPDVVEVLDVVGVGPDGWSGVGAGARQALTDAEVVMGSSRQLALLGPEVPGLRVAWPSPMLPALPGLLAEHAHRRVCVLASGDPMLHGVGATLARLVGPARLRVHPQPSSVSLACARLGWAVQDVVVLSLLAQPAEVLLPHVSPGRRLVVLLPAATTVDPVCEVLRGNGFGPSTVVCLTELGGSDESIVAGTAERPPRPTTDLALLAVECAASPGAEVRSTVPGLPDDAFEHDGQLTKRDVRASALAHLAPSPGELLWDVGAGAGSIAVEWSRHHPSCRAVAVERDDDRAGRIAQNARRLGVPALRVVVGAAPGCLTALDSPDAVFVGGGVSREGVVDACWAALRPGGRIVVHAVTLESQAVAVRWRQRVGGDLARLQVEHAEALGSFTVWRPALAVVQWSAVKPWAVDNPADDRSTT